MDNPAIDKYATTPDERPTGATFDEMSKALARGMVSRRRALSTLGAGLFATALGGLALGNEADARKKRRRNKSKKKGRNRQGAPLSPVAPPLPIVNVPPATTTTAPPATTTTVQPTAQCLAAGNQCGTQTGGQGRCRQTIGTDNRAGLVCTTNQQGAVCSVAAQCGAGTRCVATLAHIDLADSGTTCRSIIS